MLIGAIHIERLSIALNEAFLQYGSELYPKSARLEAIAEILSKAGLEHGDVSAIADRLRK
jgi:hypothetical protein